MRALRDKCERMCVRTQPCSEVEVPGAVSAHMCCPPHGEGKLRGAGHLENRKQKGKWDQKRVCGLRTLTFMHKLWRGELQGFSVIQLVLLSCWYRKEWKCIERLEFPSSAELGEDRRHFAQHQVFLLKLARISDNKVEGELLGGQHWKQERIKMEY